MNIQFLADVNSGSFRFQSGETYDVDAAVARAFISQGVAVAATSDASGWQALVSGALNFPLAEAINVGAPQSAVDLLGSYITTQSNVPSSARDLGAQSFANSRNSTHVYIDPVNGNDLNTGFSPETAKKNLNPAGWLSGITSWNPNMYVMVARGSEWNVNWILGQSGSNFSGSMSFGSFGDRAKVVIDDLVALLDQRG
jgi:hypothetical protein